MRNGPLGALGCAIAFGIGTIAATLAAPTSVAVVDIAAVINGLDEMAALNDEMTRLGERLTDEGRAKVDEAKQIEEEMRALQVGSDAYLAKARDLIFARRAAVGHGDAARQAVDMQRAARLAELYWKVRDEIKEMSDGTYDLVLLENELQTFQYADGSNVPRSVQVEQQIATHSMLFVDDALDITATLLQRMNNDFQLGR